MKEGLLRFETEDIINAPSGTVLLFHHTVHGPMQPEGMYADEGFYGPSLVRTTLLQVVFYVGDPAKMPEEIQRHLTELSAEFPGVLCSQFNFSESIWLGKTAGG